MKKLLIISYYWPPSGGVGVQRWLKFSKYLVNNHECHLYTPENPDFDLQDASLIDKIPKELKVVKTKIWEPYYIYKAFLPKSKKEINNPSSSVVTEGSSFKRMITWIRANLIIPDPRKFWIKPSVKFLYDYITTNDIDVIISTGPPHSMHLIALGLKEKLGSKINWVADFRDPWTNYHFFEKLKIGKSAFKKHQQLEKAVIKNANHIVTVSPSWANDFVNLGASSVKTITNGFEPEDFNFLDDRSNDKLTICHIGSISIDRIPHLLFRSLANLIKENIISKNKIEIKLIGDVVDELRSLIAKYDLKDCVKLVGRLSHRDALKSLKESHVSLLLVNNAPNVNGIIPAKLFEYIAIKNPILAIANKAGDAAKLIEENHLGQTMDFDDDTLMKNYLNETYSNFYSQNSKPPLIDRHDKFTIENLTSALDQLL